VLELLELMPNASAFSFLGDLEEREVFKEKKKYLVLMSTN
jgi:hypothetical protein